MFPLAIAQTTILPTGHRLLIRLDQESGEPIQTEGGILTAHTLAAAVTGEDTRDAPCSGVIVARGPAVGMFQARPFILRRLHEWLSVGHDLARAEVVALVRQLEALPENIDAPEVGQRVVFSVEAGHELTQDGDRYIMIQDTDVLGIASD